MVLRYIVQISQVTSINYYLPAQITTEDCDKWKTLTDEQKWTDPIAKARGLLFVCYQSSIDYGFFRQTTGFANNDFFPIISLVPQKTGLCEIFYQIEERIANLFFFGKLGQDPIIGGPKPVTGVETEAAPNNANKKDATQDGKIILVPVIGRSKPATQAGVETEVPPNNANQTDVTQDGAVSLELTNSLGDKYAVDGIAKKIDPSAKPFVQEFFVTSRGGEYYFVPSIDTVKSWGANAQSNYY